MRWLAVLSLALQAGFALGSARHADVDKRQRGLHKHRMHRGHKHAGSRKAGGQRTDLLPKKPATSLVAAPVAAPPSAPAPAPAQPVAAFAAAPAAAGSSSIENDAISLHTAFRAKHAAGPLVWNQTIADLSQTWADRCIFEHSQGKLGAFGENIAAGYSDFAGAFSGWTDGGNPSEESQYNPDNPPEASLHFTQVVWKATTQVGCAVASCSMPNLNANGNSNFYVCDYSPQGNVFFAGSDPTQLFKQNVTP